MSIYRAALRLLTPAAEPDLLTELKVKKNIAQHERRRILVAELIQVDEHLNGFVERSVKLRPSGPLNMANRILTCGHPIMELLMETIPQLDRDKLSI